MTGYTGFSGITAEQSGNYLALHCTAATGYTIKARTINGLNDNYVTLDDDGIIIVKVLDKATQRLEFVAYDADGNTETQEYSLTGLTLNEE